MEGKKSSFVDDFFPRKEAALPTKSDILSSIFPPRSPVEEQDSLHHESSPARERKKGSGGQNSNDQNGASAAGSVPLLEIGNYEPSCGELYQYCENVSSLAKFRDRPSARFHDSPSKGQDELKNNNDPVVLGEIAKHCPMSSSVYYGSRDDFIPESSSFYKSGSTFNNKKDKQDDYSNMDVATRGDWWQGSFYY